MTTASCAMSSTASARTPRARMEQRSRDCSRCTCSMNQFVTLGDGTVVARLHDDDSQPLYREECRESIVRYRNFLALGRWCAHLGKQRNLGESSGQETPAAKLSVAPSDPGQ